MEPAEPDEELESFLDNALDLIQSVTPDGRFTFVNRAWLEALGYRKEEVGALNLFDVIHPESRAHCQEAFQRVLSGKSVDNVEALFVTKAGRTITVQGNANCRLRPDGVCITQSIFRDITQRKRMEETLRRSHAELEDRVRERTVELQNANVALGKSEAQYKGLLETAEEGIWILSADQRPVFVNPKMAEMTGYTIQEMLGKTVSEFVDPEFHPILIEQLNNRRKGLKNQYELRIRRKNGDDLWIINSASPMYDESGEYAGSLGMLTDITGRKRMELFQETQHRVQELIVTGGTLTEILHTLVLGIEQQDEAMLCSILLLDEAGKHLHRGAAPSLPEEYNRVIEGVAIGPSVGSCGTAAFRGERVIVSDIATDPLWADYKVSALKHGLRACWSEPIMSGGHTVLGSFAIYYQMPRTPGEWDLFLIERAARLAGIAIEQRRGEAALQRSRDELEMRVIERTAELADAHAEIDRFFTLSLDMLCLAGFDGFFKKLNPIWENVLGFSAAEMLAQPFLEFVHPEDRAMTTAEAAKLGQGGVTVAFENRYRRKDGTYRWFLWAATAHTESQTIYAVARDITERKGMESLLRTRNEELKAFSYTVSHDLKAPLRGITGYAQELVREHTAGLDERSTFCLEQIVTASNNLSCLIDDLLQYSQLDRETPNLMNVDLKAMITDILKDHTQILAEQQTELSVTVPPGRVAGWEQGMRQVLSNLIDNAIKYSRKATPPRVEIRGEDLADLYRVWVKDNGIGFDMKYHDRIFGLFNRLVRQEEFEGTGAGLAIVKKVIEKLGGRVWAESERGKGAVFCVEWPKKVSNSPTGELPRVPQEVRDGTPIR